MKKACKKCRLFVDGTKCPLCQNTNLSDSWKGRLVVTDANQSEIGKVLGIKAKGEYAIKVR